ncbi:MAG: TetR/AcrR family transcriptional regulator [Acidimicrobiales bacterium]
MPRRSEAEARQTCDAVVAAARRAFTRHGFAGASTSEIAAAAGVTRGAVYHHFPDKTALFRAAFGAVEAELDAAVRAAAGAETNARAAFLAGGRAMLDFMVRPEYRRLAAVEAPAVLGLEEWHATDAALGLRSVRGGLRALHRGGYLAEPPTPTLALFVFGALTEAGLALSRGEPGVDAIEVIAEIERLLDRLA